MFSTECPVVFLDHIRLLEQDILNQCLFPDRARSRNKQSTASACGEVRGGFGPGAVRTRVIEREGLVVVVVPESVRRRSRQAVPRPKVVQFSLTEEEFADVSAAADRLKLARGAYAAGVVVAAARQTPSPALSPLREALTELMTAAGLVRRAGTNLNQAVAKLNSTGQPGADLIPAAEFCVRVIRRLDEAAEQVRRAVP